MFTTRKGSENWKWQSKEEQNQREANFLKDREPKLTKRRSLYRQESDIKPIASEQQTPQTDDEDVEARPKAVIRIPSRRSREAPAAKSERQEMRPRFVEHTQNEPNGDVEMTDNNGPSNQDLYIQSLLHELRTRDEEVKQLQQEHEQQKQAIQELTTSNAQRSMNASADVQNRNIILKAKNADLQKRLQTSEKRNMELEEENLGLRAAYDALLTSVPSRGGVPNHEAMLEAVHATTSAQNAPNPQPRKCQGFQGIVKHTETYVCQNPKHPATYDSVSCTACTNMAVTIGNAKGREVARSGGVVVTICQRCCWENGEHLKEECECLSSKRCILCMTDLLNKMAEDANDMEAAIKDFFSGATT
ncbi:uncharacterized protein MYCFIDRAFT_79040 [Pseudocercospora fijiensis CIRAD86]|uniref:Uncharacterized protein n=1 Tax=Pseudocercospora fijiensis (strain CIRAD86) TaxID=383855 RepID=M3AKX1_PSEFD|nr:uncharacterized protein MYCFIDRAFT_79040 [Pseudocercospora fijiensis CIRAD86]EME77773.1 hypothetical protein MYCFIDRAFT_79040 [Pseudocercospora fijiensis CIRAD86]